MPTIEGGIVAIIAKYGWLKALTLGSALLGAGLMAVFRPPATRREMLLQALVALGCSFLFGDTVYTVANNWLHVTPDNIVDPRFYVTVHGLVGAMSWGIFGGLAHMRDKVSKDPIQAIKDVKDIV